MTTIAYKDGILAADSQLTLETAGGDGAGDVKESCLKIFRKTVGCGRSARHVLIATAGEAAPGMVFVDWYGSGKKPPASLTERGASIEILIVTRDGAYRADSYCRPEKVIAPFVALGTGSKAALGAMHAGASAEEAVRIACKIDPYSAPPVITARLKNGR